MSNRACLLVLCRCCTRVRKGGETAHRLQHILERMAAYNRMKAESLCAFAVDRFYCSPR